MGSREEERTNYDRTLCVLLNIGRGEERDVKESQTKRARVFHMFLEVGVIYIEDERRGGVEKRNDDVCCLRVL